MRHGLGTGHGLRVGIGLLVLAGLVLAAPAGAAPDARGRGETPAAETVSRLEGAVARHPDDPDLLWALARELRNGGRSDRAARAYARFEARFPGRRPEVAFERGRALYEAGEYGAARVALERALARDGGHAAAQLYRGLALRQLGEDAAADRSLRAAAALDPEVAPEALLLRGLARLRDGERDAGERLLREAAALDPGGEISDRARRVLGHRSRLDLPVELSFQAGFEYDDNVTLDSGLDLPGGSTAQRDARWLISGGVSWHPVRRENASVTLGYRFDQSEHDDLDAFDEQSHLLYGSTAWRATDRMTLRFDAFGANTHLDADPYLLRGGLRPNLLFELGPRAGLVRAYAEAEARDYRERPGLPSLERDGHLLGAGLEHYLALPGVDGGYSALGLRFARTATQGDRDADGLGPAFDHDLWEASWQLAASLPWRLEVNTLLALGHERYSHRNVIDFLTDGGIGTTDPDRRRDVVVDARVAMSRPLTDWTALELAWRRIERHSNVELYSYDRQVLGLYLRLHSF